MIKNSLWEPHLHDLTSFYSKNFYWTTPHFIDEEVLQNLLKYAEEKDQEGLFKPATIGKGKLKKRITDIRSDSIFWIDDFSTPQGKVIFHIFDGLSEIIRKEFYQPVKRFECHFAKYEPGCFYKLHKDRHKEKPGRLVTCVLYLKGDLGQSGELILYDENLKPIRIQPEPGRIVLFDSSLEHEVLVTQSNRWSLTGWLRDDLHSGIRF